MTRFESKYEELEEKEEKSFMPFVVLGDPDYDTSLEIVKTLVDNGADALELGFPFSDPVADGPTVQEADQRALEAGMNTDKAFKLLKEFREYDDDTPISLLIYYNLIMQRGVDKFYKDAREAGVDAVLTADCPVEEVDELLESADKYDVDQVFLVTPATSEERMEKLLSKSSGYAYLVSLLGVTGARSTLKGTTLELIKRAREKTKTPLYVGFGISKPEHVESVVSAGADGAIVGSAGIKIIKKNLNDKEKMLEELGEFVSDMKEGTG